MLGQDEDLKDILATARAIHFAYQQEAISLVQAKDKTKPLLLKLNKAIKKISKEFNVKPAYISFNDLGRRI